MLKEIREKIEMELKERIGENHYLCDLGMEITESENADGSYYCSSYEAKKDILENWDFVANFVDWYDNTIGDDLNINPFSETEKFHCVVMILAIENAFNWAVQNTKYDEFWNDDFEISEEFINDICKKLEEIEESDIF